MVKWEKNWPEVFALSFLVLGFILSIVLRSPLLTSVSILLAGFIAGRVFYCKRYQEPILPTILVIVGFLLGYLLGGFWSSPIWTIFFFTAGFLGSYYLHKKKIIGIFKNEGFVK